MNDFVNLLAVFVSSVITSMGLGGGSFYILYLTFFTDTEQFTAQGYNLLLFLPCAVISVIVYAGKKIISFKYIWPIVLGGIAGFLPGLLLCAIVFINRLDVLSSIIPIEALTSFSFFRFS